MKSRLALVTSLVAGVLVLFAGWELWRPSRAHLPARVMTVAWRCEALDGPCTPVVETERCATCHKTTHPLGRHEGIGCVACHGGDGTSTLEARAHSGLATLRGPGDVAVVQARCALCHEGTTAALRPSPARDAWKRWMAVRDSRPEPATEPPEEASFAAPVLEAGRARFAALRCGACHTARDASPPATPLDTLALRSSVAQLVTSLEQHAASGGYDLHLDRSGAASVAAYLRTIQRADVVTLHRASVPGSSAAEGHVLATRLRCDVCHTDLAGAARLRTADWLAYYLLDPRHADRASRMPSLRLSAREAASLAQAIAPAAAPAATTQPPAPGEALVRTAHCESCHTAALAPSGPSLARWGDAHDASSTLAALGSHTGYTLSAYDRDALATYLLSQVSVRVRPDLRVAAPPGVATFGSSRCEGCHTLDDPSKALSLYGEGLRVLPQWLFEYLRAPGRHPVRPPFHPEEAYRDLVPADRVAVRMPTYGFDDVTLTDLVRFFDARDGASFPFASNAVSSNALTGDALAGAIGDVTRKDRGGCLSCHTVAAPDPLQAREQGNELAPPLSLAHERLRPAWIEACLAQPEKWVHGMPAFARPIAEIARVSDLLLMLRERTVLPPPGSEGVVPALGLGDLP